MADFAPQPLPNWRRAVLKVGSSLLAGDGGLHVDKLVEGMFGYLDVGLVLITAMIFMKILEASGLLAELTRAIIVTFGRSPLGLLLALTVVIMFPGCA